MAHGRQVDEGAAASMAMEVALDAPAAVEGEQDAAEGGAAQVHGAAVSGDDAAVSGDGVAAQVHGSPVASGKGVEQSGGSANAALGDSLAGEACMAAAFDRMMAEHGTMQVRGPAQPSVR